jgi:hypothetical protein
MNKKDSFVFYSTFLDTIDKLEQAGQQEFAYKVLKAVIDVGIYGEYTGGDPLVESFLPTMQLNIENAAKRYEAASNGGKKSNHSSAFDKDLIIELKLQGMKNADVAQIVGEKSTKGTCSSKTVSRVWNEYLKDMGQSETKVGQIEMSMDKPGQKLDKPGQIIGQSETSHGQNMDKVGQNMDKNGTFTVSWQDENGNFVF